MAFELAFDDERLEKALWALADDADPMPGLECIAGSETAHQRELAAAVLGRGGRLRLDRLRELTAEQPYRPERWLLLGAGLSAAAWDARGTARAEDVSDHAIRAQQELVAEARHALRQAAGLDRDDPVAWSELTGVVIGAPQHRSEPADVFARAGRDLFRAHSRRLTGLSRRWYGNQDKVLAFARARVERRPDGDPLHALIALAHIEGYVDGLTRGTVIGRFWRAWRYFDDATVQKETDAASGRLLAGDDEHPWAMAAHQVFAALYHQAHRPDRARPHLDRSGTRAAEWPWRYFGEPEQLFQAAKAQSN
ncbi:hypothetical protein ACFFX1_13540 [Dactylosporangium sucinum]|uniref:DUF4034 domain-containing protein n=1 Tax=Dactylosporangium sucinum TaxID=1424081 RepID=A0A917X835_9ACTN|nr:hypothetical protein [Dactylosporangium sucinum]GGM87852.1 hypothetical protein GCM10007977_107230 [Dactylosporangium sucinum]